MKSSQPRAAPKARSPSAATFVSRSRNAGRPSASASPRRAGRRGSAARGSAARPRRPLRVDRSGRRDADAGDRPRRASAGASCAGVARGLDGRRQGRRRARRRSGSGDRSGRCRVPSGWTIAARIRVPPRSTAMTGREDRAKPRFRSCGARASLAAEGLPASPPAPPDCRAGPASRDRAVPPETKTPAGRPAGVLRCQMRSG